MANNTAKRYLDLEGLKTFYDLLVKKFADKSELVTLNTSVGGLTTKVSDVEAKASENATEIEGLKSSLEGKADADALSALDERVQAVEGNLGDKNVIEGIKLNGTLVEPNENKIVELTVEGGSAGTISMTTT